MQNETQKTNVNAKDIEILKKYFKDNEALLKSMRALMLSLPIDKIEKKIIKETFADENLMVIMWKKFCPLLNRDTPIGQVADVWLGVETMIFGVHRDTIEQAVLYKEKSIEMVKKALALLVDPDGEKIDIEYSTLKYAADPLQINLLARNQFIRHVESQLMFLWIIANQETTSAKEVQERIKKNSTQ